MIAERILSSDAERLLHLLRDLSPHREVYRGRDGSWWITYGGGPVSPCTVRELFDAGKIAPVYSDLACVKDVFHVGRTMDTDATAAERRAGRKKTIIYKPEGWRP